MTEKKFDGAGPAFPLNAKILSELTSQNLEKYGLNYLGGGMTLWDYFAAHALSVMHGMEALDNPGATEDVAHIASLIADAMLEERKKRFG